jgi:hypothetical protein
VPADDKRNARLIISQIVVDTLQSLDLSYPKADANRIKELHSLRRRLQAGRNGNVTQEEQKGHKRHKK